MALATLLVYLAAGLALAVVLAVREGRFGPASAGHFLLRLTLWPIFLPQLSPQPEAPRGAEDARIQDAEGLLADALRALGSVLGDGLELEMRRVAALGRAMRSAAARQRELDGLLAAPEHDLSRLQAEREAHAGQGGVAEILDERIAHVHRLAALRAQTEAELERALARAGELATRLTLLRYDTGTTPDAGATAQQLASSIDELCSVLSELKAA